MQSIANIIKQRESLLIAQHKEHGIWFIRMDKWKRKEPRQAFFIPNKLIRVYLPLFKKRYGRAFANHVLKIYCSLATHAGGHSTCYPSLNTIMREACISNRNQLKKYLKMIEDDLNMIKSYPSKGGHVPNVYFLLDPNFWKPENSIIHEITVSKEVKKQYQNADTGRTDIKEVNYKDLNFQKIEKETEEKEEENTASEW